MSSARESAERCLSWVVDRDEPWDRATALQEAQTFATLAVADEIRALRGEIEKLTAVLQGRAFLAEGEIKGRVDVSGPEAALSGGETDGE